METTTVALAEELRRAYNNLLADHPQTLELFTEDVSYTDPRFPTFEGKEALRDYLRQLAAENQALQVVWEFTNIVAEGERAAVEWSVKSGIDFGGKPLEFAGAAFFRARDGKISYYRGYWDTAVLQRLMGG
jgi:ketosteroid isomerase-like protein